MLKQKFSERSHVCLVEEKGLQSSSKLSLACVAGTLGCQDHKRLIN